MSAAGLSTSHGRRSHEHYCAIARLAIQASEALDHAHELGVIHRDVKPSNLMLDSRGTLWVTDFGLAHVESNAELTMTGDIIGTLRYMSPEQTLAKRDLVDHRTDIYSLGATLYELLTLRPTFDVYERRELLQAIVFDEPRPPSKHDRGIPAELETIVLKCLQKSPSDRYSTASELADELRRFTSGMPILARPVSRAERFWRWCRREPVVSGLSAAVVVVLAAWSITATVMAFRLNDARYASDAAARNAKLAADEARNKEALAKASAIAETKAKEDALEQAALAVSNERKAEAAKELAKRQHVELATIVTEFMNGPQRFEDFSKVRDKLVAAMDKSAAEIDQVAGRTGFARLNWRVNRGEFDLRRGKGNEALSQYQQAYEDVKHVVEEQPDNDRARANLGVVAHAIGKVYLEFFDDARKALPHLIEGRDLQQDISDHPRSKDYTANDNDRILAEHELHLGKADLRLGNLRQAREAFQSALEHRKAWLPRDPDNAVPIRSWISECHLWLSTVSAHLGDEADAESHFGEALSICQELAERFPNDMSFQADLAQVYGDYGDAQLHSGNDEAAMESYRKSLEFLQSVIARSQENQSLNAQLADAFERLAAAFEAKHDNTEAQRNYKQAKSFREKLVETDRKNIAWRLAYARVLAHLGQTEEASGAASQALDDADDRPSAHLQAARVFAVCAAKNTSAGERANDARRALDALQRALPDDFHDPYVIRTEPDFASLTTDPRFQAIVERISAKAEGE